MILPPAGEFRRCCCGQHHGPSLVSKGTPVTMSISGLVYYVYAGARGLLRATGLARHLRRLAGPTAGRLVYRVMNRDQRLQDVGGHKMLLAQGKRFPPLDMVRGKYEPESTRIFCDLIRPGMAILDVGAHVGYYTLLAARQTGPTGKVYAFEPEPENYSLLVANISNNGYENIVPVKQAASRSAGSATLFVTALDNGRHSLFHHGLSERGQVPVETTSIDGFLEKEGWPTVHLVKVDVEGAEMSVLEGMQQLLTRSSELKLIMELNPSLLKGAGVEPENCFDTLSACGFTIGRIDEKSGLFPLTATDQSALVRKLLDEQRSVNLLCVKK